MKFSLTHVALSRAVHSRRRVLLDVGDEGARLVDSGSCRRWDAVMVSTGMMSGRGEGGCGGRASLLPPPHATTAKRDRAKVRALTRSA